MRRASVALGCAALVLPVRAGATDDEPCHAAVPTDYDEQVQVDFMQNHVALSTTLSPLHGPVPHEPGSAAVGLDLLVVPPLPCHRRMALNGTKIENGPPVPVVPRPRVTFAMEGPYGTVPYAGVAAVPPIPIGGTSTMLLAAEAGIGGHASDRLDLGGRAHATLLRSTGDYASAIDDDDPVAADLYVAHTIGIDVSAGWRFEGVTPYVAVGWTDASTFFWVGDDGVVSNNLHPYFGPAFAVGLDGLVGRLRWGAELYAAPGGHSLPDPSITTLPGLGRYGRVYTGRFRVALEL